MIKTDFITLSYKNIIKPILFKFDPEDVHNSFIHIGEYLSANNITSKLLSSTFKYKNGALKQNINDIGFENPIGLAAGFDYDGHLAETMPLVGCGFNTIGTVTARSYEGNPKPRLARLPRSRSLLVNKGFKSEGIEQVINRLNSKNLKDSNIGISIGSSNIPEVDTISKAIDDYIYTFSKVKDLDYVKYIELNISCPNTSMNETFGNTDNFNLLLQEIRKLKIRKPIFVKMFNETDLNTTSQLVRTGIDHGMNGFIFSNLVKNRESQYFNREELLSVNKLKGNFSGKPVEQNANQLIRNMYKEYGKDTVIIGCGGVFTAEDAYLKIKNGASLIQLITGMIFNGPQLFSQINEGLSFLLKKDGYVNIKDAVGSSNPK